MPNIDAILSDFLRLKSACEEMSSKKIVVGIVGEVDSEVLKAPKRCRNALSFGPALTLTGRSSVPLSPNR